MEGFEIKKSTRHIPQEYAQPVDVTKPGNSPKPTEREMLVKGVVDNMPQMIDLARDIVSIQKMKAATEGEVKILEEKRQTLLTEAEAYVTKQNADTNKMVSKMENIRQTLDMVFSRTGDRLSSEDLAKTITGIVDSMSKM